MKSIQKKYNGYFLLGKTTGLKSISNDKFTELIPTLNLEKYGDFLFGFQGSNNFDLNNLPLQDSDEFNLSFSQHLRKNNKLCGFVTIRNWNRLCKRAEIRSYSIGDMGKNFDIINERFALILSQCFDKLNLNRVSVFQIIQDQYLEKIYKKLNFTKEGLLKEYLFTNGNYSDVILWSMLRKNYNIKFNSDFYKFLEQIKP